MQVVDCNYAQVKHVYKRQGGQSNCQAYTKHQSQNMGTPLSLLYARDLKSLVPTSQHKTQGGSKPRARQVLNRPLFKAKLRAWHQCKTMTVKL